MKGSAVTNPTLRKKKAFCVVTWSKNLISATIFWLVWLVTNKLLLMWLGLYIIT